MDEYDVVGAIFKTLLHLVLRRSGRTTEDQVKPSDSSKRRCDIKGFIDKLVTIDNIGLRVSYVQLIGWWMMALCLAGLDSTHMLLWFG